MYGNNLNFTVLMIFKGLVCNQSWSFDEIADTGQNLSVNEVDSTNVLKELLDSHDKELNDHDLLNVETNIMTMNDAMIGEKMLQKVK